MSHLLWRFVNSFGYVSLFPFLLKMVPPSSHELGIILDRIRDSSVSPPFLYLMPFHAPLFSIPHTFLTSHSFPPFLLLIALFQQVYITSCLQLLWTDYGLRSLAKNDSFYNKVISLSPAQKELLLYTFLHVPLSTSSSASPSPSLSL